uniref:Uncharacterized protein n=1 Tax=Arundo donax TaxID=35708 RepID=A0A0A8ZRB3_ARUDO
MPPGAPRRLRRP